MKSGIIKKNQKGCLEIGAILVIIITTIGAYVVLSASKHIFVGDTREMKYYDYALCPEKIKSIPENNQMILKNKQEAEQRGYQKASGCVEA